MRNYFFGIIIGFLFGLISLFLAAISGRISSVASFMGNIFLFPGPLLIKFFLFITQTKIGDSSAASINAIILNGIFYAIVGGFLQKWLKKKKYVVFVFVGWILLTIIVMIVEYAIQSSFGLHVGA